MPPVIRVENLSKAYQLGDFGTGTISRDLERYWARLRGKEDPFLKIGETNDRTTKGESDMVWSLRDLNFDIEQGDAVGIIGRNGAGKSTLLKILSRVTSPTTGSVKVKGRIASLLEVGTGFHPELTGRENIFLNGAILGMRKAEIKRKFDEIVDFSGVERYIDTPVKRYSSGMYVRLAFAVAAHLESEILIVDEVLAVGDAEFQKKCLGKMSEISKGAGRTVLFVSHNLQSVRAICNSGIVLKNGLISFNSQKINEVLDHYVNTEQEQNSLSWVNDGGNKKPSDYLFIHSVFISQPSAQTTSVVNREDDIIFNLNVTINTKDPRLEIAIIIKDPAGDTVFITQSTDDVQENWPAIKTGENHLSVVLPKNTLNHGEFILIVEAYLYRTEVLYSESDNAPRIRFKVGGNLSNSTYWTQPRRGPYAPILPWKSL
jgi:lipopolysaccharide transport system ATP-binding protein